MKFNRQQYSAMAVSGISLLSRLHIKSSRRPALLALLWVVLVTNSCAASSESFANRPGFREYFNLYPPATTVPDEQQQQLLEKYKPRIYRAIDSNGIAQQGPVDFYRTYISDGKLLDDGNLVSQQVTQELLNQYRDSPTASFIYEGTYRKDSDAVVYARFDTDTLQYNGTSYLLDFLSYNLVFPASGLLKGLGGLQTAALTIAGSLNDWHQLDHYVGLSIALYRNIPVAVTLQQHNYQTSYIFSKDLVLPDDHRIQVDIAMRSNELYLHNEKETRHPAVSFISQDNIEFVKTGSNKPFMAGFDVTRGDQEIDYSVSFLAPSDAFYQFKGQLGKSRLLPGRDGPPGADYVTLPGLMPRALRLVTGYRPGTVKHEQQKISQLFDFSTFSVKAPGINASIADFMRDADALN